MAENISFPLKVRGMAKDDMDAATVNAANQVQIGDLLDRYPESFLVARRRVAPSRHHSAAMGIPHG